MAVRTQPTAPTQTCAVANASGTISGGNVSTVQVTCSTNAYSVGVLVSGLAGSGLALSLNGGTPLPISGNGSVTFPGMLSSGTAFAVTASTEPASPTQICSVTSGSGVIVSASVTVTVARISISGFAYIIGSPAPSLAGYSIASQTGELTSLPASPFTNPSSTLPSDVAAAPNGKHIYVAVDGTIYAYSVTRPPSPQMGMLTLGGTTTIDQINRLAIDPTGRFLYATSAGAVGSQGYVAAFTIDAVTGVLTAIANCPSGSNPGGISVYPTGRYLLVTNLASNDVSSFSIMLRQGRLDPSRAAPSPLAAPLWALPLHQTGSSHT